MEILGMVRLGYSRRELETMYLGEFWDKYRLYQEISGIKREEPSGSLRDM